MSVEHERGYCVDMFSVLQLNLPLSITPMWQMYMEDMKLFGIRTALFTQSSSFNPENEILSQLSRRDNPCLRLGYGSTMDSVPRGDSRSGHWNDPSGIVCLQ